MPQKQSIIQTPGQIGEEDKIAGNVFKSIRQITERLYLGTQNGIDIAKMMTIQPVSAYIHM